MKPYEGTKKPKALEISYVIECTELCKPSQKTREEVKRFSANLADGAAIECKSVKIA